MQGNIGIGMVGVGRWGKKLIGEFARQDQVIGAYYQGSAETTKWLADTHPAVRISATLDELLDDGAVRAIIIATPIRTHAGIAMRALEAGKHVFLEKPGGASAEEYRGIVELARAKKLILRIGYIFLHHPAFRTLEDIHRNDPVVSFDWSWHRIGSFHEPIGLNLACHPLSLVVRLWGKITDGHAYYRQNVVSECDALSMGVIAEGRTAFIHINRAAPGPALIRTFSTESGRRFAWKDEELMEFNREHTEFRPIPLQHVSALEAECRSFLDSLRTGTKDDTTLPLIVHQALERFS